MSDLLGKLGIRKAPWSWKVNESSKSVSLHSHGNGGYKVMDFTRWGMQSAQPRFCKPDGIMHDALELSVDIEGQEHNSSWNKTLKNNEAQLIAASPEMLERDIKFREYLFNEIDKYIKLGDTGMVFALREVWKNFDFTVDEKATGKTWDEIKELIDE